MKIKTDFVTNSSSTSFILAIEVNEIENFEDYCNELTKDSDDVSYSIMDSLRSIEELIEYTNGRAMDWASKPRGICFNFLSKEEFNIYKDIIEQSKVIAIATVEYNVVEEFYENWEDCIVESS